MNFGSQQPSTNYVDDTNPTGLTALRNYVGNFLYTHGITKGATGQYYDPNAAASYEQWKNTPQPPLNANGQRSDIDWQSNNNLPGYGLMSAAGAPRSDPNDAMARAHGFANAATMAAYYQKQQQMRTGTSGGATVPSGLGGMLQQALSLHPSMLLNHVLDKWNQATGGQ